MNETHNSEGFVTPTPDEVRDIIKPAAPNILSGIRSVFRARWTVGTADEDQIKAIRQNPRILITSETCLTPRIDGAKGWEILFKVRDAEMLPT